MFLYEPAEQANKAALILVQEAYERRFASFVKDSKARLHYVADDLDELILASAHDLGADYNYVKSRFDAYLALVLDKDPPHEDLAYKSQGDGLPPASVLGDEDPLHLPKTDVRDLGDVDGAGLEEALEPDARIDLNSDTSRGGDGEKPGPDYGRRGAYSGKESGDLKDESTWNPCFRCGDKLNPVYAQTSPVCKTCTIELKQGAGYEQEGDVTPSTNPMDDDIMPLHESLYRCKICGESEGSRDQVLAHVQQDHQDVLQRVQQNADAHPQNQQPSEFSTNSPFAFNTSVKEGDNDVPDANDPERAEVQPQPNSPADNFDAAIQDMADRAAAEQFSQPSEQDIHSIASTLGLTEDQVRGALVCTALIGNYHGVNGALKDSVDTPEGYEEVAVDQTGGRIEGHEALVPVDPVVNKVAEDTNSTPELVYQQVKDKYGGGELPTKYHASISGERHFYLPTQMAGQQPQEPQYDQQVGPTAPPAPETQPAQPQQY